MVFSLLSFDKNKLTLFSDSILGVRDNIVRCDTCNNICERDNCIICDDKTRKDNVLFVVEHPKDVILFERLGIFNGQYQVIVNVSFEESWQKERQNTQSFTIDAVPDGLLGIALVPGTVAGTANIVTACGGIDVGAQIASVATTTITTAFINEAGANPTTATIDPDTGIVSIAPAGSYRIAPASVLDGLDIVGYDGLNKFATITGA